MMRVGHFRANQTALWAERIATMAISDFLNLRWHVNEETRLSSSSWQDCGVFHRSVGLFRKRANRWELDHETVVDLFGDDEEDVAYKATACGFSLVVKELGYEPMSFFRNNLVQPSTRRKRSA